MWHMTDGGRKLLWWLVKCIRLGVVVAQILARTSDEHERAWRMMKRPIHTPTKFSDWLCAVDTWPQYEAPQTARLCQAWVYVHC